MSELAETEESLTKRRKSISTEEIKACLAIGRYYLGIPGHPRTSLFGKDFHFMF
jgi:hypothetical protein